MRRAAKRDANEAAIVKSLEHIGATVERVSQRGFPDLAVRNRDWPQGMWCLMEVKGPEGNLTEDQIGFFKRHGEDAAFVVRTSEEAVEKILAGG